MKKINVFSNIHNFSTKFQDWNQYQRNKKEQSEQVYEVEAGGRTSKQCIDDFIPWEILEIRQSNSIP